MPLRRSDRLQRYQNAHLRGDLRHYLLPSESTNQASQFARGNALQFEAKFRAAIRLHPYTAISAQLWNRSDQFTNAGTGATCFLCLMGPGAAAMCSFSRL